MSARSTQGWWRRGVVAGGFGLLLALAGCGGGGGGEKEVAEAPRPAGSGVPVKAWTDAESAALRERYGEMQETASGLRYKVMAPAEQPGTPPAGASVTVHYHGMFLDGRVFDSSRQRGTPFVFRLGLGRVIAGWDEAVAEMQRGEARVVAVPWWLAYGERGMAGRIPPRSALIFEIELLDWQADARAPGGAGGEAGAGR